MFGNPHQHNRTHPENCRHTTATIDELDLALVPNKSMNEYGTGNNCLACI